MNETAPSELVMAIMAAPSCRHAPKVCYAPFWSAAGKQIPGQLIYINPVKVEIELPSLITPHPTYSSFCVLLAAPLLCCR